MFFFSHPDSVGSQISRIASSRSSFAWPAASLNPAKLCLAIHAMSLQLGLQLVTHTPVYSVTSSDEAWSVNTSRGAIISPKVVHCTNAYSGALLDEVKPFVTPVRGESFDFLRRSTSSFLFFFSMRTDCPISSSLPTYQLKLISLPLLLLENPTLSSTTPTRSVTPRRISTPCT